MPTNKIHVKKVKGWVILDNKNKVIAIEIQKSKPKRFTVGTWTFYVTGQPCVPVTISYQLPLPTKRIKK